MSPSALEAWLLSRGTVLPDVLEKAQRRQRLYGGSLDTVLLEQGAIEEEALRRALAEATGLPLGSPGAVEPAAINAGLDAATARALGAVPLTQSADRLTVAVHLGSALEELFTWAKGAGLMVEPTILPEVRFEAAFASHYGVPLAPRHVALLGRLLGRDRVRQWAARHAPPQRPGPPPVETGPAPVREAKDRLEDQISPPPIVLGRPVRTALPTPAAPAALAAEPGPAPQAEPPSQSGPSRDSRAQGPIRHSTGEIRTLLGPEAAGEAPDPEARLRALRGLRAQLSHPKISARLVDLRERVANPRGDVSRLMRAISDLAALADPEAVPILFERLRDDDARVSQAAHAALVEITKRDFGTVKWRWGNWWRQARHKHRIEWLIDALGGKSPELRLAAALELEQLGSAYVGYHFDLGKRDRDEARKRWLDWWQAVGKARFELLRGPTPPGGNDRG